MSIDNTTHVGHGDILVVDDNISNLKFLTEILTEAGHRVRPASDGELALLSAQAKAPELILLDIKMPGMSGIDVCHHFKADPETRDIPIIFLSALTETEMKVKALKEGGDDYVTKPIEPTEVLARIEIHLYRYRLQQKLATQSLELIKEIEERKRAEEALQKAHDNLEIRVEERTSDLIEANKALHIEIAERKKSEDALRENENFLRQVIENIPDMIFIKEPDELRFVRLNSAGEELLGYSREELYGKNDYDFFPTEEADFFTEKDRKVLETRKLHDIPEEEIQTKNKGSRILHTKKIPLLDKDGTPLYLLGISQDITERKRAEDELKSSERNLALVQQVASVGSWTWDVINDKLLWSEELYRICGVEKEGFAANYKSYLVMVHPDDRGTFRKLTETAFKEKENYRGEYRIVRPDTKVINIYEQGVVVCAEDGKVLKLMGTVQDVTEKKKLEEELFQAQKMEAIGTLAGGIAHDFNNILTAIMGFAEIAKMELPESSPAKKDIDQVITAGKRATDLVKRILTFSRKTDLQKEPLHIDQVVKEAVKMLRSSLPTTVEIETDIHREGALVLADPTSIHQVVMNLCTNSLQAMENEKGTLSIKLYQREITSEEIGNEPEAREGTFVTLSVQDTGSGMEQKVVEKIFDPFFTTKEVGKGTGLGLSVIHGIILEYSGFIQVNSTPGQGTTFFVNLPVIEESLPEGTKYVTEKELPTGTEHILCVDDEISLVELNTAILERSGYTVTGETSSRIALENFITNPSAFDLVITDQTMPEMTGAEMAQAMMRIRPELPVILCTGYSSILSKEETLSMKIKRYQDKPVSKTELLRVVREVLDEV